MAKKEAPEEIPLAVIKTIEFLVNTVFTMVRSLTNVIFAALSAWLVKLMWGTNLVEGFSILHLPIKEGQIISIAVTLAFIGTFFWWDPKREKID